MLAGSCDYTTAYYDKGLKVVLFSLFCIIFHCYFRMYLIRFSIILYIYLFFESDTTINFVI